MKWYPPAESRIPLESLFYALIFSGHDFPQKLCSYVGSSEVVLANSGRELLYLLINELHKKNYQQDEILLPGYTCYSLASSAVRAGLNIRVYDLDPRTLQPDMKSLARNISSRTLLVIHQHLFGVPVPIDETMGLAQGHGIPVVEDATQALGGTLKGKALGTLGDFGLFSFGRGKPLPLGGGGALIGKDRMVVQSLIVQKRANGYRELMMSIGTQILSNPWIYGISEMLPLGLGKTVFDPGFPSTSFPEKLQVLASITLKGLDEVNRHRREIAETYREAIREKWTVPAFLDGQAIYTRFPVLSEEGDILQNLFRKGVRRMYPKCLIDEESIKRYIFPDNSDTPGAREIARKLMTLPTHHAITKELAFQIGLEMEYGRCLK